MPATQLLYLSDPHASVFSASVLLTQPADQDGLVDVVLDQTLFYPRGGGQESDTGEIRSVNGLFRVDAVRFLDGIVHHLGQFITGSFKPGESVESKIDEPRRFLNSRLHTAGHLIDEAVRRLGLGWIPTKGIHYPGQAAVEYEGNCSDPAATERTLETEVNRLIQERTPLKAEMVSLAALPGRAFFVPPNLPENKPIRVVSVGSDKGLPCGGTHVRNTGDIGILKIRYIKLKKSGIKVAYDLEPAGA